MELSAFLKREPPSPKTMLNALSYLGNPDQKAALSWQCAPNESKYRIEVMTYFLFESGSLVGGSYQFN